mmetsp:Transcript_14542/g.19388  ORF Transcript_14542/g.19388 Transcript_14542/m.19388 type:complete len:160 (+) Transcript_14542:30-509(+)
MLMCHYPVSSDAGSVLCGAGDPLWAIKLSLMGYLCEISNPIMNWRWWLIQTLEKNRLDFAVVNVVLVSTFAARAVLLVYLLVFKFGLRIMEFIEMKQVFIFFIGMLGHFVILLLTLYWLKVLCRGAPKSWLVFTPPPNRKKDGGFTFGNDMGRNKSKTS